MATKLDPTTELIKGFEGFIPDARWDKNAWRIGYGSDTVTLPNGKKIPVTRGMVITRADADRDLARRIPEFQKEGVTPYIGAATWAKLTPAAQAALTSVAYNYGSLANLPKLAAAVKTGNPQTIAAAIGSLSANPDRRKAEAAFVLNGGGSAASQVASLPPVPAMPSPALREQRAGVNPSAYAPTDAFTSPGLDAINSALLGGPPTKRVVPTVRVGPLPAAPVPGPFHSANPAPMATPSTADAGSLLRSRIAAAPGPYYAGTPTPAGMVPGSSAYNSYLERLLQSGGVPQHYTTSKPSLPALPAFNYANFYKPNTGTAGSPPSGISRTTTALAGSGGVLPSGVRPSSVALPVSKPPKLPTYMPGAVPSYAPKPLPAPAPLVPPAPLMPSGFGVPTYHINNPIPAATLQPGYAEAYQKWLDSQQPTTVPTGPVHRRPAPSYTPAPPPPPPPVKIASGKTVPVGTTGSAQGGKFTYVVLADGSVQKTDTASGAKSISAKAPGAPLGAKASYDAAQAAFYSGVPQSIGGGVSFSSGGGSSNGAWRNDSSGGSGGNGNGTTPNPQPDNRPYWQNGQYHP